ncbi:hypothetical protein CAP31_03055 [Sulfuriferula sp. AH1]|nr:hypothetical protein CAP31_03055 [Sulfuriferula sp. AH1]
MISEIKPMKHIDFIITGTQGNGNSKIGVIACLHIFNDDANCSHVLETPNVIELSTLTPIGRRVCLDEPLDVRGGGT